MHFHGWKLKRTLYGATLVLGLSLGSACSSSEVVTIATDTGSAMVYTLSDEVLGATPLIMDEAALAKAKGDSNLDGLVVKLRQEGYENVQVYLEPRAYDSLTVNMRPKGDETFKNEIIADYSVQTHDMIAQFLRAQGYISSGQVNLAAPIVQNLLNEYPKVATTYVIAGNLAIVQRDRRKATEHFSKAIQLAPTDADISRSLERLRR